MQELGWVRTNVYFDYRGLVHFKYCDSRPSSSPYIADWITRTRVFQRTVDFMGISIKSIDFQLVRKHTHGQGRSFYSWVMDFESRFTISPSDSTLKIARLIARLTALNCFLVYEVRTGRLCLEATAWQFNWVVWANLPLRQISKHKLLVIMKVQKAWCAHDKRLFLQHEIPLLESKTSDFRQVRLGQAIYGRAFRKR